MNSIVLNKRERFFYELWNSITHGIGVIAGIVFLVLLVVSRAKIGNVTGIVSYSIYGACFIFLFLMSTIYHAIPKSKAKSVLRVFDHISIYYFIAGSFTPPILIIMEGWKKIVFLVGIWIVAVIGTIFKIKTYAKLNNLKRVSTVLYVLMGWLGIFFIRPILQNYSWHFLLFLILGGVVYTLGTIFYKSNRFKYNHVVWHIFVLAAAVLHFIGFYLYL